MSELEAAQKRAWRYYKKLQATRPYPYSKVLNEPVRITTKGWEHLRGARRAKKRTPQDTIRRYALLSYVTDIIETGYLAGRRVGGFIFLQKQYEDKVYRVVLAVDERGNHTFISVIDVT